MNTNYTKKISHKVHQGTKQIQNLKSFVPSCLRVSLFLALTLFSLACEQPFKAGLGSVVDTRPPTIVVESPGAGSYIYGVQQVLLGFSEDDYKLNNKSIEMMILSHAGLVDGRQDDWSSWKAVNVTLSKEGRRADWNSELDTTAYNDGDIKIKVRSIDASGRRTETSEVAYFVKNKPPVITMALPNITEFTGGDYENGQLGGDENSHVNYGVVYTLPEGQFMRTPVDINATMIGMVSDNQGVNLETDTGLYPPQYRIWEVSNTPEHLEAGAYPPGYLPPIDEVAWIDFSGSSLEQMGLNDYKVSIDIDDSFTASRYYGFELRAQSCDDNYTTFRYPRDYWRNVAWSDDPEAPNEFQAENRYILIYVRAPSEEPDVSLYGLENIGDTEYSVENLGAEGDYPFVDESPAYKSGDFTLRVRARHSEGIGAVEVYYQREGTGDEAEGGRFIWDPRQDRPITTAMNYSEWGREDPGDATARSYVFTYKHNGGNVIGNDANYHSMVKGLSSIHRYKGDLKGEDWTKNKLSRNWPMEKSLNKQLWEEIPHLREGTYNIEVWARSRTVYPMSAPRIFTITIDVSSPVVEINSMEGALTLDTEYYQLTTEDQSALGVNKPGVNDKGDSVDPVYLVNGVVKANLDFSDIKATDAGLRTARNNYFLNDNDTYGYEQLYLLFDAGDMTGIDAKINGRWWPVDFETGKVRNDLPAKKHGPVFGNASEFKTSPIRISREDLLGDYEQHFSNEFTEAAGKLKDQPLRDGFYWVYFFSRDKALNVGVKKMLLKVDCKTDFPVFEFSKNIVEKVKDPNISADTTTETEGEGFIVSNGYGDISVRNKLREDSVVNFVIKDDDNIDTGAVSITFTGAYKESDGTIKEQTEEKYIITIPNDKMEFTPKAAAVESATVSIPQDTLLALLKANGNYADTLLKDYDPLSTNLPEAYYRFDFSIADHAPSKLPDGAGAAWSIDNNEHLWIAVDSGKPVISNVVPASGVHIDTTQDVSITGNVFDSNGPVTYVPNSLIISGAETFTTVIEPSIGTPDISNGWNAGFTATVNLGGVDGAFQLKMTFRDRFDNQTTLTQNYTADTTPPVITLNPAITVFSRNTQGVRDKIKYITQIIDPDEAETDAIANAARLANGVIHFRITADDYLSSVAGVRWWLLPADVPPPADCTDTSSVYGNINIDDPEMTKWDVYLNSRELTKPDGEYRLYIAAWDSNNNYSIPTMFQTVFFLQEEDIPYFETIRPDGGVMGSSNVKITGTIRDDDGFYDSDDNDDNYATSRSPLWIWFNNVPNPPVPILVAGTENYTGYGNPVKVRGDDYDVVGRSIDIHIDLSQPNKRVDYGFGVDGYKYYIIEARDDTGEKIIVPGSYRHYDGSAYSINGVTADIVQSDVKAYSFLYDTQPPKIEISSPDQRTTFGTTADNNFWLKGWMSDINLATDNGKYYVDYALDGTAKTGTFTLDNQVTDAIDADDPSKTYYMLDTNEDGKVYFFIGAKVVTNEFNFSNDLTLRPGSHNLVLSAKDLAFNTSYATLVFTKDTVAPTVDFNDIEKIILTDRSDYAATGIGDWWTGGSALSGPSLQNWYKAKRDYLNSIPELSIITYGTGNLPTLRGTIDDDASDVDPAEFIYWLNGDNTGITSGSIETSGRNARFTLYLTTDGTQNSAALPDGVYSIRVSAADVVGNASDPADAAKMYFFRIVSALPDAIILTSPANTVFGSTTYAYTYAGTASSANLKDVRLRIVETENPTRVVVNTLLTDTTGWGTPTTTFTADINGIVTEELAWEYRLYNGLFTSSVSNPLKDGLTYDLIVTAIDLYNNESVEVTKQFTVDLTSPVIDFGSMKTAPGNHTPNDSQLNPADADSVVNVISGEDNGTPGTRKITLRGSVIDATSNITTLQSTIEYWNYSSANNGWQPYTPYNGTDWVDGNASGNLTHSASPSRYVSWTWEFAALPEGLYRIQVRAADSAWIGTGNPGTDGHNPATSDYMYFYCDSQSPKIAITSTIQPYYTFTDGTLTFNGTVDDLNMIRSVTVRAIRRSGGFSSQPGTWAPDILGNPGTTPNWPSWEVTITGLPTASNIDTEGIYTLEFEATDLAGRRITQRENFTLDNTPPEGSISQPRAPIEQSTTPTYGGNVKHSIVERGGQDGWIYGGVNDPGNSGNESGIEAVWFHLGYLADGNFPTETAIKATVLGSVADNGNNNGLFDIASQDDNAANRNLAWFKLTANTTANAVFPLPEGFDKAASTLDPYGFILKIPNYKGTIDPANYRGGFKQYVNQIALKTGGTTYNGAGAGSPRLTKPVPLNAMPENMQQNGVFSLPVWFRVADKAGNVHYFCHDIWIFPMGDIPDSSIDTPSESSDVTAPKGGSITVAGEARDMNSVGQVIFRVFADAEQNIATRPLATNVVTTIADNGTAYLTTDSLIALMGTKVTDTAYYVTNGWYNVANNSGMGDTNSPWSFILNSEEELAALIQTRGFDASNISGTDPLEFDTIRVWIELFVFNQNGEMSYGDDPDIDFTNLEYRPYVRVFYLNKTAPEIMNTQVSAGVDLDDSTQTYMSSMDASSVSFGRYFTLKATLDAKDEHGLGTVSLRRSRDTDTSVRGWKEIVMTGVAAGASTSGGISGLTITRDTVNNQQYELIYEFDSWATGGTQYGLVNGGAWGPFNQTPDLKGGKYSVELRIADTKGSQKNYTFTIGIDNYAPTVERTTMNRKVAGSSVDFTGKVYDVVDPLLSPSAATPTQRGIKAVYAWFTRDKAGTNIVSMKQDSSYSGVTNAMENYYEGRSYTDEEGVSDTQRFRRGTFTASGIRYPAAGGTIGAKVRKQIGSSGEYELVDADFDNNEWIMEISERKSTPGSGVAWQPTNTGNYNVEWLLNVNSTLLNDGVIYLNYIVLDDTGNATYDQRQFIIMNKRPEINAVTLFTSNDARTTVNEPAADADSWILENARNVDRLKLTRSQLTTLTDGYVSTEFISKNKYIGFKVETLLGNPPLNYTLQYVERELQPINNTTLMDMAAHRLETGAHLYTIKEVGTFDWELLGAQPNERGGFTAGQHFVLDPSVTPTSIDVSQTGNAAVYHYTQVGNLSRARNDVGVVAGNNPPILPNDDTVFENGKGFNFKPADFDSNGSDPGKIWQYKSASDGPPTHFFLIMVTDSVDDRTSAEMEPGERKVFLYDAAVISMDVWLTDTEAPEIATYPLNPYTEFDVVENNTGSTNGVPNLSRTISQALAPDGLGQNATRGGLYNAGNDRELVRSGYIDPKELSNEYRTAHNKAGYNTLGDTGNNTDNIVSGQVIVRGNASDNMLIGKIYAHAQIGVSATVYTKTILELNTTSYSLQHVSGEHAEVYDTLHWKDGHTVEWAWLWDTQQWPAVLGGAPADDVKVWFSAEDYVPGGGIGNPSDVTAESETQADIRPFIIGFEREMPKYATKRSLQGWYSFFQSEEEIALKGYNLDPSNNTLLIKGVAHLTTPGTMSSETIDGVRTVQSINFTVNDTARSGAISLTSGVYAAINQNNRSQSWDKEYFERTAGSTLWTNSRSAHIWRSAHNDGTDGGPVTYFGNDTDYGGSRDMKNPAMTLIYNGANSGKLYSSWASDLSNAVFQGLDPGSPRDYIEYFGSVPLTNVDMGYYHSEDGASNYAAVAYNYRNSGNPYVGLKDTRRDQTVRDETIMASERRNVSGGSAGSDTSRYQSIRVARTKSANLTSFYDSYTSSLKVSLSYFSHASANPAYVDASNASTPAITIETGGVGRYNAIDYTSTGPVIAYSANNTLKLAYATLTERTEPILIDITNSSNIKMPSSSLDGRIFYTVGNHGLTLDQPVFVSTNGAAPNNTNPKQATNGTLCYVFSIGNISPNENYYFSDVSAGNCIVLNQWPTTNLGPWENDTLTYGESAYAGSGSRIYLMGEQYQSIICTLGSFTTQVIDLGGYQTGSGEHVSIKVDHQDNIHMAFFNAGENALVYVKTDSTGGIIEGPTVIDKVIQGGTLTDITVDDQGNPFIIYADTSRIGNYDGMRMAYKSQAGDTFNGAWEAVQVPSPYTVKNDRLNIEAWPPAIRMGSNVTVGTAPAVGSTGLWNAAIGYASDQFRLAYFYKPQP